MLTHSDRILDFVRRFPGRDDDEIATALGIQPRQTVNLNCRKLERMGCLERRAGAGGKVSNFPVGSVSSGEMSSPGRSEVVEMAAACLPLRSDQLVESGFSFSGSWELDAESRLRVSRPVSHLSGVYAFAMDGRVCYVGLATKSLARRLYLYSRPGNSQRTNQRLNGLLREALAAGKRVSIFTAHPPELSWNGLPVRGDAGLELGLIKAYELPWNRQGVR